MLRDSRCATRAAGRQPSICSSGPMRKSQPASMNGNSPISTQARATSRARPMLGVGRAHQAAASRGPSAWCAAALRVVRRSRSTTAKVIATAPTPRATNDQGNRKANASFSPASTMPTLAKCDSSPRALPRHQATATPSASTPSAAISGHALGTASAFSSVHCFSRTASSCRRCRTRRRQASASKASWVSAAITRSQDRP